LGDGERYGVAIQYSDEGASALETGGGICRALPLLGDAPFWVVNGDVHTHFQFNTLPLPADKLAQLVLVNNPDHNPSGDFALEGGLVRNSGNPTYTYSGIGQFSPALFAGQSDGVFPLAPLLRRAADDNSLAGELYAGMWSDVGTPQRMAEVENLYSV
jgi:MurNAc alpha-1-phosphate uridylyltransferase